MEVAEDGVRQFLVPLLFILALRISRWPQWLRPTAAVVVFAVFYPLISLLGGLLGLAIADPASTTLNGMKVIQDLLRSELATVSWIPFWCCTILLILISFISISIALSRPFLRVLSTYETICPQRKPNHLRRTVATIGWLLIVSYALFPACYVFVETYREVRTQYYARKANESFSERRWDDAVRHIEAAENLVTPDSTVDPAQLRKFKHLAELLRDAERKNVEINFKKE
jgi:hypothetical protein